MHLFRLAMIGLCACTLLAACAQDLEPEASSGPMAGIGGAGGEAVGSGFPMSASSATSGSGVLIPPDDIGWSPPSESSDEPCNALTKHIYVVAGNGPWSTSGTLYSFWPPTLSFHLVGNLMCPIPSGRPMSMAIDQHGTAWVLYSYGGVHQVDLATGQCTKTPFAPPNPVSWASFGMAFVSDGPGLTGEALYVREGPSGLSQDPLSRRLGRFDTTTFTITALGEGAGQNSDLTGTADGRLFGLVRDPDRGGILTEFNKTNGAAMTETLLAGINVEYAWALSAWEGGVWLFTSTCDSTSDVDRFDFATGKITPMLKDVGFHIVGAGVSTCAPAAPPN